MDDWRVVRQEPAYEVNALGQARRRSRPSRLLKGSLDTHGYRFIQTGPARQRRRFWVHVAVAEAFHGCRPGGHVADHINRDRQDCRAVNLRWVTHSENVPHGEDVKTSRLNPQAVQVIRHVLAISKKRGTQLLLARLHGVTHEAIRKVKTGESWGGVSSRG